MLPSGVCPQLMFFSSMCLVTLATSVPILLKSYIKKLLRKKASPKHRIWVLCRNSRMPPRSCAVTNWTSPIYSKSAKFDALIIRIPRLTTRSPASFKLGKLWWKLSMVHGSCQRVVCTSLRKLLVMLVKSDHEYRLWQRKSKNVAAPVHPVPTVVSVIHTMHIFRVGSSNEERKLGGIERLAYYKQILTYSVYSLLMYATFAQYPQEVKAMLHRCETFVVWR